MREGGGGGGGGGRKGMRFAVLLDFKRGIAEIFILGAALRFYKSKRFEVVGNFRQNSMRFGVSYVILCGVYT